MSHIWQVSLLSCVPNDCHVPYLASVPVVMCPQRLPCPIFGKCPCCHVSPTIAMPHIWQVSLLSCVPNDCHAPYLASVPVVMCPQRLPCPIFGKCPCCHVSP